MAKQSVLHVFCLVSGVQPSSITTIKSDVKFKLADCIYNKEPAYTNITMQEQYICICYIKT